jgi:hypothetical protein
MFLSPSVSTLQQNNDPNLGPQFNLNLKSQRAQNVYRINFASLSNVKIFQTGTATPMLRMSSARIFKRREETKLRLIRDALTINNPIHLKERKVSSISSIKSSYLEADEQSPYRPTSFS